MSLATLSMVVLLLGTSHAATHSFPSPRPVPLRVSSAHLLDVPPFGFTIPAQCDGHGNFYFGIDTGTAPYGYVRKLSSGPQSSLAIKLPAEQPAHSSTFGNFYVGTSQIWLMNQGRLGIGLFAYDSSGKLLAQERLHAPVLFDTDIFAVPPSFPRPKAHTFHFHADVFAVSPAGPILLNGRFTDDTRLARKDYIYLFDRTGRTVKQIDLGQNKNWISVPQDHRPIDAAMTVGSDGYFYYANSEKLLVIRPDGKILRQMSLHLLPKRASVNQISISRNLASITYYFPLPPPGRKVHLGLIVINLSAGKTMGSYLLPEGKGSPACFSSDHGYTIVGFENGKMKLTSATIPK
jgi:hypothetical protein